MAREIKNEPDEEAPYPSQAQLDAIMSGKPSDDAPKPKPADEKGGKDGGAEDKTSTRAATAGASAPYATRDARKAD